MPDARVNYTGPDESVECAYPPCTNRLRRSDFDELQFCSKEHRDASPWRVCQVCGFTCRSAFRQWCHTYLEWAWWRPFDKRPYHVRNACVRWLP